MDVDHWSDVAINSATTLVAAFQPSDWAELSGVLSSRDSEWKTKCVESLGDHVSEDAAYILLALVRDGDRDVVQSALDSLQSLVQLGLDLRSIKDAMLAVTDQLPATPELTSEKVFKSLLRRVMGRYAPLTSTAVVSAFPPDRPNSTLFEVSIRDAVSVASIREALRVFFSLPEYGVIDHLEFFDRFSSLDFRAVGISVCNVESGYRSLVDLVMNFAIDDDKEYALAVFLSQHFRSEVAIGESMPDEPEASGRYLVISPDGRCRRAIEVANGEFFEVAIIGDD